jgi:hypothetical protein
MKPPTACYYLFNKVYAYPAPADPREAAAELARPKGTPFRCLKTSEAFGPDGAKLGEDCCTPDRACYRPEVEL